ncbi:FtsB family cell division protein [Geoalkalibacter sp.]|uniref:FtsB family cell division protein n=1 Tax=Geoalkalibacter sp. TaxID=3041440 RepID=UPI00272EE495|nr:septum formation initiator family protein [Geoalkalibacter sp.]
MAADEKDVPVVRNRLRPPLWMIALVLALLGAALFGDKGVLNTWRMLQHKESLQEKIAELEAENTKLRREVDALRNDGRYLEGVARRDLGMVKEDELVYQFPTPARPTIASPPEAVGEQ